MYMHVHILTLNFASRNSTFFCGWLSCEQSADRVGGGKRPKPRAHIRGDDGVAGASPSPPTTARAATAWGTAQNGN